MRNKTTMLYRPGRQSWRKRGVSNSSLPARELCVLAAFLFITTSRTLCAAEASALSTNVASLVRQLDASNANERDAAEKQILALAEQDDGANRERVFELLPAASPRMSPELQHRVRRLRQTISQAIAESVVAAKRVSLELSDTPLSEALAAIEVLTDNRARIAGQGDDSEFDDPRSIGPPVTVSIEDKPFWQAIDSVLDVAEFDVQRFSGDDSLSIVPRSAARRPRKEASFYAGPFRFEATEIYGFRDLSVESKKSLRVSIEIAWEPRLRPIRIAIPLSSIEAVGSDNAPIAVLDGESEFQSAVQAGTQAEVMQVPFMLPPRSVQSIASLRGQLIALIPGRIESFVFEKFDSQDPIEQRRAGVVVTLQRVRKNNELWDIHMRVRFDKALDGLESHFGWVLRNASYLAGADGRPIDYVGLETTHQTPEEIGLAYTFELPEGVDDLSGLKWTYQTPAAIVRLPVDFELKDIALP